MELFKLITIIFLSVIMLTSAIYAILAKEISVAIINTGIISLQQPFYFLLFFEKLKNNMIRNSYIFILLAVFAWFLFSVFSEHKTQTMLNKTAAYYTSNQASEVGAANVVTAIVVTYRGLDTLGEVTVLFLTTLIIGYILKLTKSNPLKKEGKKTDVSEILSTGARILVPGSIILGSYIFMNGHLTPGGGFQGGAVIGTAILLISLAEPNNVISVKLIHFIESISGFFYVSLGIAGLILAGGFLDNRILPLGTLGELLSAGAIPVIYSLIGLKVGAEISGIVKSINDTETETTE